MACSNILLFEEKRSALLSDEFFFIDFTKKVSQPMHEMQFIFEKGWLDPYVKCLESRVPRLRYIDFSYIVFF